MNDELIADENGNIPVRINMPLALYESLIMEADRKEITLSQLVSQRLCVVDE